MKPFFRRIAVFGTALAVCVLTPAVSAASEQLIVAAVEGQVVSVAPCQDDPSVVCQTVILSGRSTVFGELTAQFTDRVDITTGKFVGTGLLQTRVGTVRTQATGQVLPTSNGGLIGFIERHEIVSGTGRYANATGAFTVVGTTDSSTGKVQAVGVGSIVF